MYVCARCHERVDDPLDVAHVCADRREDLGSALVSDDYRTERRELLDDPILSAMAEELGDVAFPDLMHDGGTPRFELMLATSREYQARGGTKGRTIGGPARALIALLIALREREIGG